MHHEVQESKLSVLHCLNSLLQGPFFSVNDLSDIASNLDHAERQVIVDDDPRRSTGDLLVHDSHNVTTEGNFSIQVIEKALKVWNLQAITLNSSEALLKQRDLESENVFICHSYDHLFCIRKDNGEWYNFNSLYSPPSPHSKRYISAFIATHKISGWSVFLIRGNLENIMMLSVLRRMRT